MTDDNAAMAALRGFLEEKGWRYLADTHGGLRGLISGDNGQWHWYANLNCDGRFLIFKTFCPLNVPARRKTAAAEYLMRANWGLTFGNFEMDWSDGQVTFRTSATAAQLGVGRETFNHMIYANHSTVDRYLPGLFTVVCGSTTPKKVIVAAERNLPRPPAADGEQNGTATSSGDSADGPESGRRPQRFSPTDN